MFVKGEHIHVQVICGCFSSPLSQHRRRERCYPVLGHSHTSRSCAPGVSLHNPKNSHFCTSWIIFSAEQCVPVCSTTAHITTMTWCPLHNTSHRLLIQSGSSAHLCVVVLNHWRFSVKCVYHDECVWDVMWTWFLLPSQMSLNWDTWRQMCSFQRWCERKLERDVFSMWRVWVSHPHFHLSSCVSVMCEWERSVNIH